MVYLRLIHFLNKGNILFELRFSSVALKRFLKVLITRKKTVTQYGDGYELDLLWWSFLKTHKYWIIMLYKRN